MKVERCADCGQKVEYDKTLKKWGVRKGKSWTFYCRIVYDPDSMTPSGWGSRVLSVDYHYVDGEQPRFRAKGVDDG